MGPLITLIGDDIVKASLLKPTKEEQGTSPTLEEKAILLSIVINCHKFQVLSQKD